MDEEKWIRDQLVARYYSPDVMGIGLIIAGGIVGVAIFLPLTMALSGSDVGGVIALGLMILFMGVCSGLIMSRSSAAKSKAERQADAELEARRKTLEDVSASAKKSDFNSFRASILDLIDRDFADDTQEVAFLNFLDENWEACTEAYHPGADAPKAPIRAHLVELDNARIALTKAILSGTDQNRIKSFVPRVKHLHRAIIDTFALLNNEADLPEGPELEALEQRIEDIEDEWDAIEADFEN